MKVISRFFFILILVGCGTATRPVLLSDGQYYMIDTDSCAKYQFVEKDAIFCFDKKGKFSAAKVSLSNSQLSRYYTQQQILQQKNKRALQSLNNTLSGLSSSLNGMANGNHQVRQNIQLNESKGIVELIYSAKDCNGSVVNGKCHGVLNATAKPKKCYGKVVLGQCHGVLVD